MCVHVLLLVCVSEREIQIERDRERLAYTNNPSHARWPNLKCHCVYVHRCLYVSAIVAPKCNCSLSCSFCLGERFQWCVGVWRSRQDKNMPQKSSTLRSCLLEVNLISLLLNHSLNHPHAQFDVSNKLIYGSRKFSFFCWPPCSRSVVTWLWTHLQDTGSVEINCKCPQLTGITA